MESKKIISIYGTSHSGSTLLGSMLGSSKKWDDDLHIGEAHAFFDSKHSLFGQTECNLCNSDSCRLWSNLSKRSENPYNNIFRKLDINTIIDSSKIDTWYDKNQKKRFEIYKVIIWRNYPDLLNSFRKRKDPLDAEYSYAQNMTYLKRNLNNRTENTLAVSLERLTLDPASTLKKICDFTDTKYFKGKEEFWNFEHHHMGGARTVRNILKGTIPAQIKPQGSFNQSYNEMEDYIASRVDLSIT